MLSTGEQRRLTIASVLIHQPQLLLLDEPFIGQDYENVKQLMLLLQEAIKQKAAVILASHDPYVIQAYCHRLLFLQDGQLLLDDSVSTAFNKLAELGKSAYLPSHLSEVKSKGKEVPS